MQSSRTPDQDRKRRNRVEELVGQLKSGKIDDKVLFLELQKLQKEAAVIKKAAVQVRIAPCTDDTHLSEPSRRD